MVNDVEPVFWIKIKLINTRRVLKTLREAQKENSKEDNICKQWARAITNGIRVRHRAMFQ